MVSICAGARGATTSRGRFRSTSGKDLPVMIPAAIRCELYQPPERAEGGLAPKPDDRIWRTRRNAPCRHETPRATGRFRGSAVKPDALLASPRERLPARKVPVKGRYGRPSQVAREDGIETQGQDKARISELLATSTLASWLRPRPAATATPIPPPLMKGESRAAGSPGRPASGRPIGR
jgi:hypothetical protein